MVNISIWEKETFFAPQDVVIIGSGLVGLWSALYLKKENPHARITIIEKGVIPTGASTRNAGFACFGSLSEVISDAGTMGTDNMLTLVEKRYKGIERIRKHFPDKMIDLELCGGFELYDVNDKIDHEQLQHNITYINSLLKPVTDRKKTYSLADEKITEFGFGKTKHLVKNKLEGYLHSGKLMQVLLKKVQGLGVTVFNQTSVLEFQNTGNAIELRTDKDFSMTAKQVLLCTNAFTKHLLPEIDIIPARGQVLLTSPIENLPWRGTFHSDEGFYYFRNLGKKVLLGGARNKAFDAERTTEMVTSDFIQSELEKYLHEVILPSFQGSYTIESRWSGIMAMGSEKMPIIKQFQPGIFCAVRMSGMGVALAPVVGQEIAKMMSD